MSRVAYSIVCIGMVAILLAMSLGACGSEPTPTLAPTSTPIPVTDTPVPPTATPLPTPTPSPTPPSPQALLETAFTALDEDSCHIDMEMQMTATEGGFTMEIPMTFSMDLQPPDRAQATLSMSILGMTAEVDTITIGETIYATNMDTGEWEISPDQIAPFDPREFTAFDPAEIEDLTVVGEETLDGTPVYHLRGKASAEQLGDEIAGTEGGLQLEYWIAVEDSRLRQLMMEGELSEEGTTIGLTATATYSGYGQAVTIEPPEIATAAAAASGSAIAEQLDCDAAGEGFVAYGDDELGIGFCYPSGWVVDDMVEMSGVVSLSPQGFGAGETLSDCLVLIYPHEMLVQFPNAGFEAEEIVALGFTFFVMIVQDATSDEWPTTASSNGQETATLMAHGTVDGEEVLGIITGITKDGAMGMAISYVLDEEAYRTTAEAVMDSTVVALPAFAQAGEVRPIALNEFQEGSWTAEQAGQHRFQIEDSIPVLLVGQLLAQGGLDDKADLQIFDPQGVFVDQFTTGWMGAQTYTSDSETLEGLVQNNVFGYLQPDALRVVLEQDGEYTIGVGGDTFWHDEGKYRLGIFDMRPDSPAVLELVAGELAAGEAYEYEVDGAANRPTIAYLRPTGPQAEDLTLSLELLDGAGESLEERHNYSYSGDEVFLYWVPREAGPFTVRVTEVDEQPAQFELTMLQEPGDAELEAEGLLCDQYRVEIDVQENGALQVEERQAFVSTVEGTRAYSRTLRLDGAADIVSVEVLEGDEVYAEGDSAEAGTYQVIAMDSEIEVRWHALSAPGSSTMFTLRYTVVGGVQTDAEGRDVVTWQAMQPDRDYRIRDGLVVVRLPAEVEVHEIIAFGAQGTGSAECDSFDAVIADEVTFELSHDLLPGQAMDIRVIYGPE